MARWFLFSLIMVLSPLVTAAVAQQNAVTLTELQRIAGLPESEQRRPAQQAILQRWFFQQVDEYHAFVRESAIGRSPLVSPGWSRAHSVYQTTFATPTGQGPFVILLLPAVSTATTDPNGYPDTIVFPAQNITPTGGNMSTCWHEALHTVLGARDLSVNPLPYESLLQNGDPNYSRDNTHGNQEHVYINVLAENTFLWLRLLKGFEKEIGLAANHLEELKANQAVTNFNSYEVEKAVWGKARLAWKTAWKYTKNTAYVPPADKDEFARFTGVQVPYVEEVIAWYMAGNMTIPQGLAHAGAPVRVPRWVMEAADLSAPAVIECANQRQPALVGDQYVASLDLSIQELRQGRVPITHGTVQFWAQTEAANVRFQVTLGGKSLPLLPAKAPSNYRAFQADLAAPAMKKLLLKKVPFRVTVVVTQAHQRTPQSRDLVIPLHVYYKDTAPAAAAGSKAPQGTAPLYAPTEGVYLVKIVGGPGPLAPAAAAKNKPGAGKNTAALPNPQRKWVLVRTDTRSETRQIGKTIGEYTVAKAAISVGGGEAESSINWRSTRLSPAPPPEWGFTNRTNWNDPPATLQPGAKVSLAVKAASRVQGSPPPGYSPAMSMIAWYSCRPDNPPPINFRNQDSTLEIMPRTGAGYDPAQQETAEQNAVVWTVPPPAGNWRYLTVSMRGEGEVGYWQMNYIYSCDVKAVTPADLLQPRQPAVPAREPAAAAQTVTSIETQPAAPPSEDKRLGKEPPRPGEVIPPVKQVQAPPPSPQAKERWYTHAEGAYQFRLPAGWVVAERRQRTAANDAWDTLSNPQFPYMLLCGRGHRNGSSAGAHLSGLLGGLLGGSAPKKIRPMLLTLGGATATVLAKTERDGVCWDISLQKGERTYLFQVVAPAETSTRQLPGPVSALLDTLRFQ